MGVWRAQNILPCIILGPFREIREYVGEISGNSQGKKIGPVCGNPEPVGQWMGYSFTDLGAEGCCRSLNALLKILCSLQQTEQRSKMFASSCMKSVDAIQCLPDWSCFFSCDQAALWMVFSVRLSVCLSVRLSVCHTFLTMFPSSYHHEIFRKYYQWQKWRPCKRSRSEVKGQGHRGQHPT